MKQAVTYFRQQLRDIYPPGELQALLHLLLEKRFGVTRLDVCLGKYRTLSVEEREEWQKITERLQSEEPVQYILGEADFCGLTLRVTPDTLIPRPETAELVRWVADDARRDGVASLLDVGTGSGCIALSLASLLPGIGVEGWDVSEGALRVARDNGRRLGLAVRFLRQDILAPVLPDVRFDVVVSNPPYVTEAERAGMERNVLCWEPASALFVPDDDPLRFYRAIARFATRALPSGGKLYFEINRAYGSATVRLLEDMGYARVELRRDLSGNDRMIKAIL